MCVRVYEYMRGKCKKEFVQRYVNIDIFSFMRIPFIARYKWKRVSTSRFFILAQMESRVTLK